MAQINKTPTSRGLFPEKQKDLQKIQKHKKTILHRSVHLQREQDVIEKSRYGLDWLQKGIWYGPTKLDYNLPQNVQNIRNHENLKSGIYSTWEKFNWNKDPKRYIPGRFTITIIIYNYNDDTTAYSENAQSDTN